MRSPIASGKPAAWIYAMIALSVVPVLVPFAFLRSGAISSIPVARFLVGCGLVSGTVLLFTLVFGTMHATIDGHHINYHVGTPWLPFTLGLYIVATCAPGLVSSTAPLRVFGGRQPGRGRVPDLARPVCGGVAVVRLGGGQQRPDQRVRPPGRR